MKDYFLDSVGQGSTCHDMEILSVATVLKRRLLTSALLIAGTYPISKLQKGHKKPISGVHCWNLLNRANKSGRIWDVRP